MIVEILEEDESRVRWSYDNGKTWEYADIGELIGHWDGGKWIPVSERLPEEDGHYLVYAPSYRGGSSSAKENHEGIMFSRFCNGKWSIEHGYYKREGCVRAWMPLEPYKE